MAVVFCCCCCCSFCFSSLTQSTTSLPELWGYAGPSGAALPLWSPSQGEPVRVALGGGLLQRWQQALLCQVSLQGIEDVELLIDTEGQELLDHLAGVGAPDEASNVDINKCGHEVLAVKSVHNATMTRDSVGKILDLEGSLEAAGKEATERSHNGGKGGESNAMYLERIETHCGLWRQRASVRQKTETS